MKIGIIVGRFQTPILHAGHLYLIGTVLQECDLTYVFLGNSIEKDERNPYSSIKRKEIINKIFPTVIIRTIRDRSTDKEWSIDLDKALDFIYEQNCFGDPEIILYHSRDSFVNGYKGKYSCKNLPEIPGFSATLIRERLKSEIYQDPKYIIPKDIYTKLQIKKEEAEKARILQKQKTRQIIEYQTFKKECLLDYNMCPVCGNDVKELGSSKFYTKNYKCNLGHNHSIELSSEYDPD